jgi:hypothetical protein
MPRTDAPKEGRVGREPEINPSSVIGSGTAGVQPGRQLGRGLPRVTVSVILGLIGLVLFGVGLFAVTESIRDDPVMYFYVDGDRGGPVLSAFPAQNGYFCEQYPFLFPTCADVNLDEFDPQLPAFAKDQPYEVWMVMSDRRFRCQAIAINVGGQLYTSPVFGWLAPLNAATPWALLFGFFLTVSATFGLARRKAWVTVPVLVLPILLALTYVSSHPFLGGC